MIIAFLVSLFVIGGTVLLIVVIMGEDVETSTKKKILCRGAIGIMTITLLASVIESACYKEQIYSYKATKHTYEVALQDEDLTGLERLNIVQSIVEKNEWLAQTQHYASQWYGFHLPREILELETIEIKRG